MRGSRRRLPRALRAGLEPGERVLAWGRAGDPASLDPGAVDPGATRFVVVTSHRLLAPGIHEPVRWEHAVLASWAEPVLAITSQTGPATTTESIYVLTDPGTVPAHVRDRIESMAASTKSLMPEGLETAVEPSELADLFAFVRAGERGR